MANHTAPKLCKCLGNPESNGADYHWSTPQARIVASSISFSWKIRVGLLLKAMYMSPRKEQKRREMWWQKLPWALGKQLVILIGCWRRQDILNTAYFSNNRENLQNLTCQYRLTPWYSQWFRLTYWFAFWVLIINDIF